MIHQYKNNGYDIVMDIASGSVHVVDDVVYDAIAMLEPVMGELEAAARFRRRHAERLYRSCLSITRQKRWKKLFRKYRS